MDFTLLQGLLNSTDNATSITHLPTTLLDTFIPGYSVISQLIYKVFGFDIGLVVSACLVVFALAKTCEFLWEKLFETFLKYFISSIHIADSDTMFTDVMEWVAEQRMAKDSRDLRAVTKYVADNEEDDIALGNDADLLDERGIFNYDQWISNIPPRFEPNYGSNRFWHKGRLFFFYRGQREKQRQVAYWEKPTNDDYLIISCVGRSAQPLKDWLKFVNQWSLNKNTNFTRIYRPEAAEEGCSACWDSPIKRPSRPMATVSLDARQKAKIVVDVNEYLQPATARWYAARGIPYRRGYLFYGPPGTGKSSLSFALAGIFGLEIYCISLMEPSLTESNLIKLFNFLPRRCIVLLEDIDSAGLRRTENKPKEITEKEKEKEDTPSETDDSGHESDGNDSAIGLLPDTTTTTTTTKSTPTPTEKEKDKEPDTSKNSKAEAKISLSGLLNAIDGVATHEGRVLIMTTNHAEHLDPALLRPGRIDMQIRFTLATRQQTRDIFIRMYSRDDSGASISISGAEKHGTGTAGVKSTISPKTKDDVEDYYALLDRDPLPSAPEALDREELVKMAERFAEMVPEDTFSPAEIQGFLLVRKMEPGRALRDVGSWRDRLVEAKRAGVSVVEEGV